MKPYALSGKVVLVCGAGSEIGKAISMGFARCGASLALQDYSPVRLDTTLKQVLDCGARGEDYIFDISKKVSAQVMQNQINDRFGKIDILVNIPTVNPQRPFLEIDEWDWQRSLEMNVNAAFLMTQLAGREMSEHDGGAVIHVIGCSDQEIASPAYAASMAAVTGFCRAAAHELSQRKIRLFSVETDLNSGFGQAAAGNELSSKTGVLDKDAGRMIEGIVSWVLFLSSQAAHIPVGDSIQSTWGSPWVGCSG